MNDATIVNLKARINMILETVDAMHSGLQVLQDRTDSALVMTTHIGQDSASQHVTDALACFGQINQTLEGQVATIMTAAEALRRYRDTR